MEISPLYSEKMSDIFSKKGKGILIRILDYQQNERASFWTQDNQTLRRYNNLPDKDPRTNHVSVSIPQIFLPEGKYTLVHSSSSQFTPSVASRTLLVQTPKEATGVQAWQGNTGYAWAPAENGFAQLKLGEGSWEIHSQGTLHAYKAIVQANQELVSLEKSPKPLIREVPTVSPMYLAPSLLCAVLFLCSFRPQRSWWIGITCGLFILPTFMSAVLLFPSTTILQAAGTITDPIDSLALVSSITPISPHLYQFQFPEGVNWLRLGPAWLGYLPAIVLNIFFPSLLAHNLGLALWWVLLGGSLYALARSIHINKANSILFAICSALSPILVDESDSLSLDRATIFIFPIILMSFHHALNHPTWKKISKMAILTGSSIYFQLYYSLYTAVILPIYALCISAQKKSLFPMQILLKITPITLFLALPAYWILQDGSMGSYQVDQLTLVPPSSISEDYAQRFLASPDHRLPTQTPTQRLLSAAKGSLSPYKIWDMSYFWLPGILLGAFYRPKIRPICAIIICMLIFTLGPVWIYNQTWSNVALPYFYLMKWIPGFDQLKNVYRFGLLCSLVLPLPLFALVRTRWACIITVFYLSITTFPHQYMERHPINPSLTSIKEGSVCFLPLGTHSPNWMIKDASQHELSIINPPSFEKGTDTLTPMYLDNPLLNRLALLSNYSDVDILHLATIDKDDIMALQEQNIRWFALPKDKLFMQRQIQQLLDSHLSRWSEDEQYIIWTIPSL